MKNLRITPDTISASLAAGVAERDAALWIPEGIENVPAVTTLVGLPWKLILSESSSGPLITSLETTYSPASLIRARGFIHIVASDPENTILPPRALPLFLLNGRTDPKDPSEGTNLGLFAKQRRRLNMLNELMVSRPRMLVLLTNGKEQPLSDFFSLWDEGLRASVVVVTSQPSDTSKIDEWIQRPKSCSVEHYDGSLEDFVDSLAHLVTLSLPESSLSVRVRDVNGVLNDIDISTAEHIQHPILSDYDLITSRDLYPLLPHELSHEDFIAFFDKQHLGWSAYSAGLPWSRYRDARNTVTTALKKAASGGSSENSILSIISESGAGGTTFARMIAYYTASEGYPTLVARSTLQQPQLLPLSRFLHRANVLISGEVNELSPNQMGPGDQKRELPWLLAFDVQHWEGRGAELRSFLAGLARDGRPAVILAVQTPFVPAELSKSSIKQIASLTHELSLDQALDLGHHLNKFLQPKGKAKSDHEWRRFWENHHPNSLQSSFAHFWIALEFWIKGQMDLSASIQKWLYESFRDAEMASDIRHLVLEIAALSIERQPLPEGLIPISSQHSRPFSYQLEEVRLTVPALALVRESSNGSKVWVMAHDLLGRYLLNSVFYDRSMLSALGFEEASDPVHLRLMLLKRVATRKEMELKLYRPLAVEFAVRILKLDATGNQEFLIHWRYVLSILDAMPSGIKDTSRAFNHHVAVSIRRVTKQFAHYDVTLTERCSLLEKAVEHIEYALNSLDQSLDDEANLNLYNSLALAYQDLADVRKECGASAEEVLILRNKATDATRKAFNENPSNSYVLETIAKNLIQQAEYNPAEAVESAAEALGHIYQAVTLEGSEFRQAELTRLADRALSLLRKVGEEDRIQLLIGRGNPYGVLAKSWLLLTSGIERLDSYDWSAFPHDNMRNALDELEHSPLKSNWVLIRFRYDLVVAYSPGDFRGQLDLVEELVGTSYRMPLQLQLEYAILLHQQGRHHDGNRQYQAIRRSLAEQDEIIDVPKRLFWLLEPGSVDRKVSDAIVVEGENSRPRAKVPELRDERIPFIPQEFGFSRLHAGMRFKASITFGRNGPFLKPPRGR